MLAVVQVGSRAGARAVVCRANKSEVAKKGGSALVAVGLAAALSLGSVNSAQADISGLTPCSESKGFAKARKAELKKLEKRRKLVRLVHTSHILTILL
jgi:photosystem I subunit III